MIWNYHTEHTAACDETRELVYEHVSGHEWDYTCSCPQTRTVCLTKRGPLSPIQQAWAAQIEQSLRPWQRLR